MHRELKYTQTVYIFLLRYALKSISISMQTLFYRSKINSDTVRTLFFFLRYLIQSCSKYGSLTGEKNGKRVVGFLIYSSRRFEHSV